jgi:hypothetical protein
MAGYWTIHEELLSRQTRYLEIGGLLMRPATSVFGVASAADVLRTECQFRLLDALSSLVGELVDSSRGAR